MKIIKILIRKDCVWNDISVKVGKSGRLKDHTYILFNTFSIIIGTIIYYKLQHIII